MRSKKAKSIIAEIRQEQKSCTLADMTFAPIPGQYKQAMAEDIGHRFNLWWRSWIAPRLDMLDKLR